MERRESVNSVREMAIRSGQGISMDAERWGESHLNSLESELQNFLSQVPEELHTELEPAYIHKYCEWLSALSRIVSPMVAGRGNFPYKRMEKLNNYADNARKRLNDWAERTIKRVNGQERLTGWAEVERLTQKLESLTKSQEMMKSANKIVRSKRLSDVEKIDELCALGFTESTAIKLNAEPEYSFMQKGFQSYSLSNNLARIKDTEARIKAHESMASQEDTEEDYEWGKLVLCYTDERIRFVFNDVPDTDTRNLLKGNAFKWSPKNGAWQRQMTPNAKRATKNILEELAKVG